MKNFQIYLQIKHALGHILCYTKSFPISVLNIVANFFFLLEWDASWSS